MSEEAIFLNSGPLLSGERLEAMEDLPEWESAEDDARVAYDRIKEAFEKHSTLLAGNPTLEETRFYMVNPTLHALGYTHSVYEPVPTQSGSVARVDYALFPDADVFAGAMEMRGGLSFFRASLALGKATAWTDSLDEVPAPRAAREDANAQDPLDEEPAQDGAPEAAAGDAAADNAAPEEAPASEAKEREILPAAELDALLRETTVDYGVLTNGWTWRIYHRGTSNHLDTFFQADIIAAIKSDFEDFKRFYLLFRKEALVRGDQGTCFVDEMLH